MKRMAREFQGQFNEAMREAELDDVKKRRRPSSPRSTRWPTLKSDLAKTEAGIRSDLADAGHDGPNPAERRGREQPRCRARRNRRGQRRR